MKIVIGITSLAGFFISTALASLGAIFTSLSIFIIGFWAMMKASIVSQNFLLDTRGTIIGLILTSKAIFITV